MSYDPQVTISSSRRTHHHLGVLCVPIGYLGEDRGDICTDRLSVEGQLAQTGRFGLPPPDWRDPKFFVEARLRIKPFFRNVAGEEFLTQSNSQKVEADKWPARSAIEAELD